MEIVSVSVLSKVLSFDYCCPQIWNIEKEKDRGKEKVGDRPVKLNDKTESDRELERETKNKGYTFCWKNNRKIL